MVSSNGLSLHVFFFCDDVDPREPAAALHCLISGAFGLKRFPASPMQVLFPDTGRSFSCPISCTGGKGWSRSVRRR
jgi:hypothetical protein